MFALQNNSLGVVQRAFQIAGEGKLSSVTDIKEMLVNEGYESALQHLAGPTIVRQLRAAIVKSQEALR